MSNHRERATALFQEGYNCAQAVFCAFADVTGLDLETSARLASSFGGGLGRLREVCGAVSGAAMVLGMAEGYADPKDAQAKKDHYARVRDFAARFREANGSIVCRELLAGGDPHAAPRSSIKNAPARSWWGWRWIFWTRCWRNNAWGSQQDLNL